MRPPSPRWGGTHSSAGSTSQRSGAVGTTGVRRSGGTPTSSPRAFPPPPGSTRNTPARDQLGSRVGGGGPLVYTSDVAGSIGKTRKGVEVEGAGANQSGAREDAGRIRVAVRVRPFSDKEKVANTRCVISMTGNQTKILDPAYFDSEDDSLNPDERSMWERTFSFDHSFWSHSSDGSKGGSDQSAGQGGGVHISTQADVHQALGEFLLDNACRGFNCSLFAYGQTGSGKTYTMLGNSSDLSSAAGEGTAGLIPRICVELFQRYGLMDGGTASDGHGGTSRANGRASIQVSFCEIYNEQVRDLFARGGSGHGLRVREHPTRGAFVEGLSAQPVTCYQQVQHLLEVGMSSRVTAVTAMNEVSSRSHAIFTIHITVTFATKLSHGAAGVAKAGGSGIDGELLEDDVSSRTSKICLVDLAGSERANATGAKGDRLREAANINKSLSTLGDVIKALAKRGESGRSSFGGTGSISGESFIPYRNSMLTWLLKDSIGGNSKTVMLAAISPVADAYQETMSTLRYVERAKEIVNSVAVNDANVDPLVRKLRDEIHALQELLEQKSAIITEHEGREELMTAALERAQADGGDKASRALGDADSLQAALQPETSARGADALATAEAAAILDRRSRDDLNLQADAHTAALEEMAKRFEREMTRVRDEGKRALAEQLVQERESIVGEQRRLRAEWEEEAKLQRVAEASVRQNEVNAAHEKHLADMQRVSSETKAAADKEVSETARRAAADLSRVRQEHEVATAKNTAMGEATRAGELEQLRKELETERVTVEREADEAHRKALEQAVSYARREERKAADAERDILIQEAVSRAVAAAEEETEAAVRRLRDEQHASFIQLSRDHDIAVRAAVDEAKERLRAEQEEAVAAAVVASKTLSEIAHHAKVKGLREEHDARTAAAGEKLRKEYINSIEKLKEQHEQSIARTNAEGETRRRDHLAKALHEAAAFKRAAEADSKAAIEAITQSHREQLLVLKKEYSFETERAVAVEKQRGESHLAAAAKKSSEALEALRSEAAEARAASEEKHCEELLRIGEKQAAELKEVTGAAEQRHAAAIDDLAESRDISLSKANAEADAAVKRTTTMLEQKHQGELANLESRSQANAQAAIIVADQRREVAVQEVEHAAKERVATVQMEAAMAIATEKEQHQHEMSRVKNDSKANIERIRADAEKTRIAEFAAAAREASSSLDEFRAAHEIAMAAADDKHREEAVRLRDTHLLEVERLVTAAKNAREVNLKEANEKLASSLAAVTAEATSAIQDQDIKHESDIRLLEENYKGQANISAAEADKRRTEELAAIRQDMDVSVAGVQSQMDASISLLQNQHELQLARVHHEHRSEMAQAAEVAEKNRTLELAASAKAFREQRADIEAEAICNRSALEDGFRRELQDAQEDHDRQMGAISATAEAQLSTENAKTASTIAHLKSAHNSEISRLEDEHRADLAAAAARAEAQRKVDLAAAEDHCENTVATIRGELENEKEALEAQHLLELQAAAESAAAELERFSIDAAKRRAAQEAESTSFLRKLTTEHVREFEAATAERNAAVAAAVTEATVIASSTAATAREEARKADAAASEKELSLAITQIKADADNAMQKLEEQKQIELREVADEREAAVHASLADASERHTTTLAEALTNAKAAAEAEHIAIIEDREAKHMDDLRKERTLRVEAIASAEATSLKRESEAKSLRESLDSQHRLNINHLKDAHRAEVSKLRDSMRVDMDELSKRLETADAATADATASADELFTRAEALNEMLQASVGSKEQELAAHRSRVAQLQAFVARQEGSSSLFSSDTDGSVSTACRGQASLSRTATRSVQQRVIDLRAMAAGGGICGGQRVDGSGVQTGFSAFGSAAFVEGLTMEKYAEELELVVVRTTVEAAASRQDHLEAEMQNQNITRQLVGLKLVHAQLRECLEDTQVKLEHKSQSAARRLLNSAARLAHEFAKPDRFASRSSGSSKSFVRTMPRAIGQNSTKRHPLSSIGGSPGRRSKSPPQNRESLEPLDLGATL